MESKIKEYMVSSLQDNRADILRNQIEEYERLKCIYEMLFSKKEYNLEINENVISNENKIMDFVNTIRSTWIDKCSECALKNVYRSNLHNKPQYTLKNKIKINYDYERIMISDYFCHDNQNSCSFKILTSSCMGSINIMLNFFKTIFYRKKLFCFAGYYETLKSFARVRTDFSEIYMSDGNIETIRTEYYDIFFIEPVSAAYHLKSFPWEKLLMKLNNESTSKLRIIVFDNSFFGEDAYLEKYVKSLITQKENVLFFSVRSLIKLDQQGLDFCFAGLITLYFSSKLENVARKIYELLKEQIDLFGVGLKYLDYCLLDNGSTFIDKNYAKEIRTNTRQTAMELKDKIQSDKVIVYYPE